MPLASFLVCIFSLFLWIFDAVGTITLNPPPILKPIFSKSCLFVFLLSSQVLFAQKTLRLTSPNAAVEFQFRINSAAATYNVFFKGKPVLSNSKLGLNFSNGAFDKNLKIKNVRFQTINETYELVVGKARRVRNHYKEVAITLENSSNWTVILKVRAYNDGVAFRYEFPKQPAQTSYELTEEGSSFRFVDNPTVHVLLHANYKTSHEGLYTTTTLDALPDTMLMDLPTLFQCSDSLYVAITEAALRDYAGLYLQKTAARTLISKLSPLPNQSSLKVKATLPHQSPWRVIMLADRVGGLIESNLLTNLNAPSAIRDVSWIRPGKTTWSWWNGDIIKNVDFVVGNNFETHRWYIDFCAANHIEYHSIIEHGNVAWYQGDGTGFDPPPPHADVTKPVESLDMERIAAYSRQKGVGLRVWVHWKPLSEKLEEAFAQYEKWNIKGLMIDFMDRDDQEMVNWTEKVLQTAAKYHLHVQFHGAYKPTGLSRTYPNEFTKEAVLNLENLKWSKECDPEHNLMIPFTRLLAGPLDYHPGGFRAVARAAHKASFLEPTVLGTRCHHLAMYVVYESYLQMVSDYPQAYENQAGFEFLQQVPTVWDETKVLDAQVGDYISVARRKGNDWYVGSMNDWTARTRQIKLDFLPEGEFLADVFSDHETAATQPNLLVKTTQIVKRNAVITIKLAAGGGQVIWIRPNNKKR